MNYTPAQLESMGVISIEESSKTGNGTVSLKRYTCSEEIKDVVIPRKINNKLVTEIGAMAFLAGDMNEIDETKSINSVIIPSSITGIGMAAFYGNKLTSVTIPNSVQTIGAFAFESNNLTSVELGDSLTSIGYLAFGFNQLTNVTLPNSVTEIGEAAFYQNKLTSLTLGNSVQTIRDSAFESNNLTSVTIPNSVQTIGNNAFLYNNLTSVTIGSGITSIGSRAFHNGTFTDSKTGITWGPNALENVYINRNSSDVEIRSSAFGWASGYNTTDNLHWNSTGPTG